jgi:hypothetical protein
MAGEVIGELLEKRMIQSRPLLLKEDVSSFY